MRLLASEGLVAAGVLIEASEVTGPASPPPGVLYRIANESFQTTYSRFQCSRFITLPIKQVSMLSKDASTLLG